MSRQPKLPPISEEEFQRQVIALARLLGWRVAHFRSVRIQSNSGKVFHATPVAADGKGFPDLVLSRRGRLIFMELKAKRHKFYPEQEEWLALLRQTPAEVHVFKPDDFNTIQRILS